MYVFETVDKKYLPEILNIFASHDKGVIELFDWYNSKVEDISDQWPELEEYFNKPSYCISEKTGEVYFMYKGVKFWVRLLMDAMQARVTDLYVITYSHKYYKKDAEIFYEQVVPDTETYCLGVCEGKLVPDEILRACDEELDKWDNIEELFKEQREMR